MHRNSEHYPDPTFGGAYDSIRQMEKASVSYTHLTLPTTIHV